MRVLAPVLLLVLVAASGSIPALPAVAADAHVHISGFAFDPATRSITIGQSAEWDNHDGSTHTVTSTTGLWNSGNLGNGASFTRTFSAAGTFNYKCNIHGSMTGKVVVLDPANLPDLTVAGVAATETTPALKTRIDVTVRNLGTGESPESSVAVAYLYHGTEHAIGTLAVGTVAAGASTTVSVDWDTTGKLGDFVIVARADAGATVPENVETNNAGQGVAHVLLPPGLLDGIDLFEPL